MVVFESIDVKEVAGVRGTSPRGAASMCCHATGHAATSCASGAKLGG